MDKQQDSEQSSRRQRSLRSLGIAEYIQATDSERELAKANVIDISSSLPLSGNQTNS